MYYHCYWWTISPECIILSVLSLGCYWWTISPECIITVTGGLLVLSVLSLGYYWWTISPECIICQKSHGLKDLFTVPK